MLFQRGIKLKLFALFTILIIGSAVASFRFSTFPILLSLILVSLPFWFLFLLPDKPKGKALWFNIAMVLTISAGFEAGFVINELSRQKHDRSIVLENVYVSEHDDHLGWKNQPNTSRISRKFSDGRLIYEALVTIDSNGLRASPPCHNPCSGAVLFFGNSCTYGEGVEDTLTLPYQFSMMKAQRFQVYNFGVFGYGPHHMLAQIEQGMVGEIVHGNVQHAVFQTIYPEHAYRASGYFEWNKNCPKYLLNGHGEPIYTGNYIENRSYLKPLTGLPRHSAAIRYILSPYSENHLSTDEKELYIALIIKSKKLLVEKYPGLVFHMILWDWSDGCDSALFQRLNNEGIRIYDAREIFDGDPASLDYRISKYDTHPSAKGYRHIAEYLTKEIR
jgi:hypothetical protein